MRNPRAAAAKLPRSLIAGEAINELLLNAATHPEAVRITKALLGGQKTVPLDKAFVEKLRELVVGLLAPAGVQLPQKSTRASTPISAEVLWAWGEFTEDPDAKLLAGHLAERRSPTGLFTTDTLHRGISQGHRTTLGRGSGESAGQAIRGMEESPIS